MHTITLKRKTTERQRGKGVTHSGMAALYQQGFAGTNALTSVQASTVLVQSRGGLLTVELYHALKVKGYNRACICPPEILCTLV